MTDWKDIPGYEGRYQVHPTGLVRSLARTIKKANGVQLTVQARILRPKTLRSGHQEVNLWADGRGKSWGIHRLLALTFLTDSHFPGAEVCHGDGDPRNNELANLRWGTRQDNQFDSMAHGTHFWSRRTHCKRDHEFTPENTYWQLSNNGLTRRRVCRTCARAGKRRRYAQQRSDA